MGSVKEITLSGKRKKERKKKPREYLHSICLPAKDLCSFIAIYSTMRTWFCFVSSLEEFEQFLLKMVFSFNFILFGKPQTTLYFIHMFPWVH